MGHINKNYVSSQQKGKFGEHGSFADAYKRCSNPNLTEHGDGNGSCSKGLLFSGIQLFIEDVSETYVQPDKFHGHRQFS